jgi:uncharacterized protein
MATEPIQPPNHPIWADLASPNLESSKEFYGSLFGWTAETVAPPEAGTYTILRLDGKMTAALQTTMDGQLPPVWRAYIHVTDAEATAEKARAAGAQIMFGPMDVFDTGRLAFLADPTGAAFGLWQPITHPGAEVMFEPGSLGWFELDTRDIEAAKRFYADVFGWDSHTSDTGGVPYTEFKLGGRSIAGAVPMGPEQEGAPPYWLVYLTVADVDASASKVEELGGKLMVPPMDFPGGRFSIVMDPHGSAFGLMILRQ